MKETKGKKEKESSLTKLFIPQIKLDYTKLIYKDEENIRNNRNNKRVIIKFPNLYIKLKKFMISLIFFSLFINSFEFNSKYTQLQSSEITLKLKNLGINKIFSDEFFDGFKQFEVYINGNIQRETKNEYNLINENEINNIKIIFKENLL